MKYFYAVAVIATVILQSASAAEHQKHLFILSGQSNMAGLDPALSFTPTVEDVFGKDKVIIVKDAHGGQPIRRWYKQWKQVEGDEQGVNGDLYDRLMEKVNAAIQGNAYSTVTFIWMQGEGDARRKNGDSYASALAGLVEQLSDDLGRNDLNVVIGRLSDYDMQNEKLPHWTKIREVQMKFVESNPRGAWVDTDDLNDGKNKQGKTIENDLHYSVEGYQTLGKRFAEKAIELIESNAPK
jgi:hypothetical protein